MKEGAFGLSLGLPYESTECPAGELVAGIASFKKVGIKGWLFGPADDPIPRFDDPTPIAMCGFTSGGLRNARDWEFE